MKLGCSFLFERRRNLWKRLNVLRQMNCYANHFLKEDIFGTAYFQPDFIFFSGASKVGKSWLMLVLQI